MERRRFIGLLGASFLAGCSEENTSGNQNTPTEPPTSSESTDASTPTSTPTETSTPTDTPTESETSTPTPAPEPALELTDHEMVTYEGEYSDDIYVRAWIDNNGDAPSGLVQPEAVFYDADGNELDASSTSIIGLPAGDTWEAFIWYLGDGAPSDYEVDYSHDSSSIPEYGVPGAELVESSLDTTGTVTVTGSIRNTTDSTIDYVQVSPHFYAQNGNLIWIGLGNVTDLAGGETWEFSVDFLFDTPAIEDRISDHTVRIQD